LRRFRTVLAKTIDEISKIQTSRILEYGSSNSFRNI